MIDSTIDDAISKLKAAISAVDSTIAGIVAGLPSDGDILLSDQQAIAYATNLRAEIVSAMQAYNVEVSAMPDSFVQASGLAIGDFAAAGIAASFTDASAAVVDAFIASAGNELQAAGITAASEISNAVYLAVIGGGKKSDLIMQVRQLLVGGTDKSGSPLSAYAETIVETRIMQVYSTAHKILGDEAGVQRWEYTGTLVRDSRPWCVQHVDKILTTEEVKAWEGKTWAGKAPGDPFIVRGGWRCRHHWRPVND